MYCYKTVTDAFPSTSKTSKTNILSQHIITLSIFHGPITSDDAIKTYIIVFPLEILSKCVEKGKKYFTQL